MSTTLPLQRSVPLSFHATHRSSHVCVDQPLPPADVVEFLTTMLPDATPQERQKVFDDTVNTQGGFEAAVDCLKRFSVVAASGVVIGAPYPRLMLNQIFGYWFAHGLLSLDFPSPFQENNAFTWSFYIGLCGQGVHSIMPDWTRKGIVVKILGVGSNLKWEKCPVLLIRPSTRVRITYTFNGARVTDELVFPPDPRESSINVHYLE
ncbi:hypothetical protein B0H13DRAFT_1966042 [Mycena leptocephala]|nr:hypothetical protein B0H13DRAFT_1966042 [Mycena leptocephala]